MIHDALLRHFATYITFGGSILSGVDGECTHNDLDQFQYIFDYSQKAFGVDLICNSI